MLRNVVCLSTCLLLLAVAAYGQAPQPGKIVRLPRVLRNPVAVGPFVTTHNAPARQATTAYLNWNRDGLTVVFDCVDNAVPKAEGGNALLPGMLRPHHGVAVQEVIGHE